ncbi:metallophosphoesterase family protein [Cytobacillus dafuensis]|uniref:DNA repair exonuclease n=1 Tax=Cytobacillus dafuensis TaxID=1742359 RepID=A0A5B8Z4B1_CYTDA|nr:DNA repair exonuclease [Cytobacillus dafuensis]QED47123.1 DNA repair exonuclease [Cytobacillus dafuensis]
MKKVTFIHAADLHLDSPMVGLNHLPKSLFKKLQESTFEALTKIVDSALIHQVDFVIFAGDLFDGEDRSIRAQIRFRKEMERLAEKNISVYVIHGNHDHMEGNWTQISMPDNVHIFSHEVEVMRFSKNEGVSVHLYGFSYPKRHVYNQMINYYSKKQGADFHIGILHGNLEGSSDHDKYAPFSLNDLYEKDFDYWALGHIHKRNILNVKPPVVYPGNIQGRNRKETGSKGCYLIHLSELEADFEFIETSSVIWGEKTIEASSAASFQDIYLLCKNLIEENRKDNKGIILSLFIDNIYLLPQEMKSILNGELLETLQEEEKDEEEFVWVSKISITEKINWNRDQLAKESDFFHELFTNTDQYDMLDGYISALYNHPVAKKYLDPFSAEETIELAKEAETLLVNLLFKQ